MVKIQDTYMESIRKELARFEKITNTYVLAAYVEATRAWGYASEDSDFDVRFVFASHDSRCYVPFIPYIKNFRFETKSGNMSISFSGFDLAELMVQIGKSSFYVLDFLQLPNVYQGPGVNERLNSLIQQHAKKHFSLENYFASSVKAARSHLFKIRETPMSDVKKFKCIIAAGYRAAKAMDAYMRGELRHVEVEPLFTMIYDTFADAVPLLRQYAMEYVKATREDKIEDFFQRITRQSNAKQEIVRVSNAVHGILEDRYAPLLEKIRSQNKSSGVEHQGELIRGVIERHMADPHSNDDVCYVTKVSCLTPEEQEREMIYMSMMAWVRERGMELS
jgi:predicted nucleotidyltransferase